MRIIYLQSFISGWVAKDSVVARISVKHQEYHLGWIEPFKWQSALSALQGLLCNMKTSPEQIKSKQKQNCLRPAYSVEKRTNNFHLTFSIPPSLAHSSVWFCLFSFLWSFSLVFISRYGKLFAHTITCLFWVIIFYTRTVTSIYIAFLTHRRDISVLFSVSL